MNIARKPILLVAFGALISLGALHAIIPQQPISVVRLSVLIELALAHDPNARSLVIERAILQGVSTFSTQNLFTIVAHGDIFPEISDQVSVEISCRMRLYMLANQVASAARLLGIIEEVVEKTAGRQR